ncbi:unnamed protein product, partial [Rotaria sp. Silwood2]
KMSIVKSSFEEINKKFNIPKIKRDPSKRQDNQGQYPTITIIRDSPIRTIYRDFVKLFSNGRRLVNTEAAAQHGEFKGVESNSYMIEVFICSIYFNLSEIRLKQGGSRRTVSYKDIREYFCKTSSTRLIYIHLPTVCDRSACENINYINELKDCNKIHAVIYSAYHND